MKNEFVPYEEALAMEELGWGKENTMYYAYSRATKNFYPHRFEFPKDKGKLIKAPLYQQAFRWLLEEVVNKEDYMITRNGGNADFWDGQVYGKDKTLF
jgi:hypothetical protein